MPQSNITRESHYVPVATLRRWSEDGSRVWAYRLLVPHPNVPEWDLRSIRGLVRQTDLYTLFSGDREADDFEKFITREIEEPGQLAIEKLLSQPRLKPRDWQDIAKFVAAQQLRTPLHFIESMNRTQQHMQESLEEVVLKFEAKGAISDTGPEAAPNFLRDSLKVTIERPTDGGDKAAVRAEIKSPRSFWMDTQRHHLTNNLHHICNHRWRAVEPAGDGEWLLTDHPVLTLNFNGPDQYDFGAGWGNAGSEFFMPVSPRLGVYTQVGARDVGRFTFSADQTAMIQRLMVKRAFRWVLARQQMAWVAAERPREVNRERFVTELEAWEQWNPVQSEAEAEFHAEKLTT